ncbi:MAG: hypothetical protein HYX54_04875 [Chloroflexi bacterium]|nr:hypothetical protein [Chloroflexota bacterium]
MGSRIARVVIGFALFIALTASAGAAAAVEPSTEPSAEASQRPPTCSERYPDKGPAGLDLRLACVVTELVGAYSNPGDAASPPRISDWLRPLGLASGGLLLISVLVRGVVRRAGNRLAPVVPASWWSCPECRSLNPTGATACYRCRRAWTPDLEVMTPSDDGKSTLRSPRALLSGTAHGLIELVHRIGLMHARPGTEIDGYRAWPLRYAAMLMHHIEHRGRWWTPAGPAAPSPPTGHRAMTAGHRPMTAGQRAMTTDHRGIRAGAPGVASAFVNNVSGNHS